MQTQRLLTTALTGALAVGGAVLIAAARPRPLPPWQSAGDPPALPPGRLLAVPGRGELFFRDTDPDPWPGRQRDTDAQAAAAAEPKPTVVLLHGWMFPADLNWFTCFEALSERYRVIAPDHRGHGRGTRPSRPFRLVDVADDVAALISALDVGPAVVVGYSMGGPIAQLVWQRHPEVVRGLVLCATSATFAGDPWSRNVWRLMGALQVGLRLLPRHWMEAALHAQATGRLPIRLTRMITQDTPTELHDLLPWIVGELDRSSAEDLAEAGRELGRFDSRGWLAGLDRPSAVVITERDKLVPLRNQEDLARRIPGSLTFPLPLDHDAPGARPDLFVPALLKAIEAVVDAAATPPVAR